MENDRNNAEDGGGRSSDYRSERRGRSSGNSRGGSGRGGRGGGRAGGRFPPRGNRGGGGTFGKKPMETWDNSNTWDNNASSNANHTGKIKIFLFFWLAEEREDKTDKKSD